MTNTTQTTEYRNQLIASAPRNHEHAPYIGKLWHSKRRWSWAVRFEASARVFDDGARWEPTAVIA